MRIGVDHRAGADGFGDGRSVGAAGEGGTIDADVEAVGGETVGAAAIELA